MGKTLAPFSPLIEYERRRWAPFKRVLLQEDQVIFDRLFGCAKLHIQAGVMVSRPWPFETIVGVENETRKIPDVTSKGAVTRL